MIKRNIRKNVRFFLALLLTLALAACGQFAPSASPTATETAPSASPETSAAPETPSPSQSAEPVELTVFAAASMTETLTKIGEMYKSVAPRCL
jgi:molybdate transport system substrate-binding protein